MKVPNNMPSHKQGGIKGIIKGSKQPIEFEGGEEFFSKDHVETMEKYMRKGNTSALGKFVMDKMKEHRTDGVNKTYLKDGDLTESTKIPSEDLAYIDKIIDFELSHGKADGTGLSYSGWSGQKVTDRESARLFIYNTIATKYSDYPIEIRKRSVDMELNSEDARGSLLVASGIITPAEKLKLYNVKNPKTGKGMMNPKELDDLWNKHKDEAMSKINESGFAETFDDEKHRSYSGGGQMYEKSQKYRIDMWDSNRENFVAPDEYKNFDYDGGSPTIGKKSFTNKTSTKPATSALADSTEETSALAGETQVPTTTNEAEQQPQEESNRNTKAVLDIIGKAESDSVGGYNAIVRSTEGNPDLTGMTLTEIEEEYGDIAVGRYQIIGETRRGLIKNLEIDPDTFVYNEENQDLLATELLKEKGLDKWINGETDNDAFLGKIATVWRGLPMDKSGKGFEEGDKFNNKATISYDEAISALAGENLQEPDLKKKDFDDPETQKKYDFYKKQQKSTNTNVSKLRNKISKFKKATEGNENVSKVKSTLAIREKKLERLENISGENLPSEYDSQEQLDKEIQFLQQDILNHKEELIILQSDKANDMWSEFLPEIQQIKKDIEADAESGKLTPEQYENSISSIQKFEDKIKTYKIESGVMKTKIATFRKEVGDYSKYKKEEETYKNQWMQNYVMPQSSTAVGQGAYGTDFNADERADEILESQEAPEFDIYNIDLDLKEDDIADFKPTEEESNTGVNVYDNYTDEEAKFFKKYDESKKKIEEQKIKKEYDVLTEVDSPIDLLDEKGYEEAKKTTEQKVNRLGLRGLVDKVGGIDAALQTIGALAGYHTATGELPIQQKSDAWKERMSQLKDRTQLGLDNQTKTLIQRNAERTYNSDVTNIGRMASSAQAALGSLGSASARKYTADLQMGALDADVRAKNQNEYNSALARDEAMSQAMWERNVYQQEENKRNVKTTLAMDAIKNVREMRREKQQYGEGSLYQQYMQSQINETEANIAQRKASEDYYTKQAENLTEDDK